ncbi:MAG: TIR domain-containing protein [Roseimicrobium sp.]
MPHVFISYARKDLHRVRAVADALVKDGIEVWWDQSGIAVGQVFTDEIARAIRDSRLVLLMASEAAMRSFWVKKEVLFATSQEKQILPLMIEPVRYPDGLGLALAGVQHITLGPDPGAELLPVIRKVLADKIAPSSPAKAQASMAARWDRFLAAAGWTHLIVPRLLADVRPGGTRDLGAVGRKMPEFQLGDEICVQLELERPGHLTLIDFGTSGRVYCLCPSQFAPRTSIGAGIRLLPQENLDMEAFPLTGDTGVEKLLAIVSDQPLVPEWLEKAPDNPARILTEADLQSLLTRLDNLNPQEWTALSTAFKVIAPGS